MPSENCWGRLDGNWFLDSGGLAISSVLIFGFILVLFGTGHAFLFLVAGLVAFVLHRVLSRHAASPTTNDIETPPLPVTPEPILAPAVDFSAVLVRRVQDKEDAPFTCEICLDEVMVGDEMAGSLNKACIHEFHLECIRQALERQPTCPCCRRDYMVANEDTPSAPPEAVVRLEA